jgi:hypothetical protein
MEGGRTMNLSHGYLVGDMSKVDQNPGRIEKPWEAMYRAILRRFTEIVKNEEGMESVERIVLSHNSLMRDYDNPDPKPTRMLSYPELESQELATQEAMENIANALPTDGNKITPGMLDSKADLQALIDGAEMFRTVKTVEAIDVNACPGATLHEPPHNTDLLRPISIAHWDETSTR